jgi:uncharacterized protein YgfB (UPF0149 family)
MLKLVFLERIMSAPSLPEFPRALRLGRGALDTAELSECHGVICGLACRDSAITAGTCLDHLAALQLMVDPDAAMQDLIVELLETTVQQLDDEELGFDLWLPDDDEALEERTISLARWCAGFLAGLASGGQFDSLSEEALEAIDDLQQIGRAELTAPGGVDEDSEDDEEAFFEIAEYVRVVALMMREEFRGPGSDDVVH